MGDNAPVDVAFDRENSPIYYYGGHGNDVCDPRTKLPIVRIVPENCIYITIAECGFRTFIQGGEEEFFRHKLSRYLLRYPDRANHKDNIAKHVKRKKDWLHIHMPGTPYVVSHFHPFGFWHDDTEAGLAISGLSEKRLLESLGEKAEYFRIKPLRVLHSKSGISIIEMIRLRTRDPAIRELKRNRAIEMMKRLIPRGMDYEDSMFSPGDVTTILRDVNVVVSKEKLLEYFEASVYPTKAEVEGFLVERFPGKEYFFSSDFPLIDDLLHSKMNPEHKHESDPMYPLSNTYMMRYFPGIHYNVVCREVSRGCFPTLQRTLSGIQEAQREGREYRIAPVKTFPQIKADIEAIVTQERTPFGQKSSALKRYLSGRASNIYVLPLEQKQEIFEYLKAKQYIRPNEGSQTTNSNILKYYIRPNLYRIQAGGQKTRKRRVHKRQTRKNLSSL